MIKKNIHLSDLDFCIEQKNKNSYLFFMAKNDYNYRIEHFIHFQKRKKQIEIWDCRGGIWIRTWIKLQ